MRIKGEHEIIGYYNKYNDMRTFKSIRDYKARAQDSHELFDMEIELYGFDNDN